MTEFEDMNPEEAAQFAQDDVADGSPDPQAPAVEEPQGVLERLFDGSADGPGVRQLQADYQIEHWMALIVRGVLRAAPGTGMPPIGDISIGGLLGVRQWQVRQQAREAAREGSEAGQEEPDEHPGPAQETSVTVNE